MRTPKTIVVVAVASLVGGAAGTGVVLGLHGDDSNATTTTSAAVTPAAQRSTGGSTAHDIYQRAIGSVATITSRSAEGTATGTGFVVASNGLIVTNDHVIEGGDQISVKLGTGGKSQSATVVGQDGSSDLALLRVDANGKKLTPLTLADSSKVQIGDATYAIGNPFGLDGTLTTGVVSATQRDIQAPDGFSISGVLQTDAALNPGNSGGPLLDGNGQVIGVNSQIETGGSQTATGQGANTGVGFAVPSNTVKKVIDALEEGGQVRHAYLGVSTADAASGGATVAAVSPNGPAADAGLQAGSVIVAINDTPIGSADDLTSAVNALSPGDQVKLKVRRDGKTSTVTVKLAERPASAPQVQG